METRPTLARRTLLILAAAVVVAQPISNLLARPAYDRWGSPGSMYHQWRAYAAERAPDVLFIGDSRVRFDVDPAAIGAALDPTGQFRVEKVGVDALQPHVAAALVTRVALRPDRPHLLVLEVAEHQFNETWLSQPASGGDETQYFWQMTEPLDPAYLRAALHDSRDPGRLLAGWILPMFANYSVIAGGIRCELMDRLRRRRCDTGERPEVSMDTETRTRSNGILSGYLDRYRTSRTRQEIAVETVQSARRSGMDVVLIVLPAYRIAQLDRGGYAEFERAMAQVSNNAGARIVDLHDVYDDQPDLFTDPGHLTTQGARALAPRLADELRAALAQRAQGP